jgi:uncharacterized protein (TIGR02453 family)
MSYFTDDYLKFFKGLAANNNKEWFDANKKRYEKDVKAPFEKFVGDLISAISKIDKEVKIAPKDAIFRINRDVRFSNDKSPYKINRSAVISKKGKSDKSYPGIYIEAGPEYFAIYGGCYLPDKDQLAKIRQAIADDPKKFLKLASAAGFKKTFGEIQGEKNKVMPKEFKEAAAKNPIICNKQFYWGTQLPANTILKKDIVEKTAAAYKAGKGLQDYFIAAIG